MLVPQVTMIPMYNSWLVVVKKVRESFIIETKLFSKNFKEKIIIEASRHDAFFFADLILNGVSVVVIASLASKYPEQICIIFSFINSYYPPIVRCVFWTTVILCTILTLYLCFVPYYGIMMALTMRIHFKILNEYILTSFKTYSSMDRHNYHIFVKKNLKFIIKWHQKIVLFHLELQQLAIYGFFILLVTSICTLLYGIFVIFSPFFSIQCALTIVVTIVYKLFHLSQLGQGYEDLSTEFQNSLYSLEWYYWNKENLQLLKIIHINTAKPLLVGFMSFRINREFFKQAIKWTYSLGNAMHSISSE